ncbi:MAG: hypothetical protein NXI32_04115 [bacterium]|nr:hypothetical protein [bacterium]
MAKSLIDIVRKILGDDKSWVVFRNGTCVIVNDPQVDLGEHAIALIKEWGPVYPGTPHGDFNTFKSGPTDGWIVTSHHNDIITYVGRSEVDDSTASALSIGLIGRAKRDRDARDCEVVYVQQRRDA